MTLTTVGLLRRSAPEIVLKLSGRYSLTDDFDLARFPRDRFGAHPSWVGHSTRWYSVPGTLLDLWERQLRRAVRRALRGWPLERSLLAGVPPHLVEELERVGVQGRTGPTGGLVVE